MKKYLVILCATAFVLGWTVTGFAVPTYDYYDEAPIEDAMIDSSNPGVNYGTADTLWIQGSQSTSDPKKMSYLKFDISSIPDNAVFVSANLGIYFYDRNPGGIGWWAPEVSLHRVSDDSWTELNVTYNNQPSASSISDPFKDILQPQRPGYLEWDLLLTDPDPDIYAWQSDYPDDLVDNMVSFRIQAAELNLNQWAKIWSREGDYEPYLAITYYTTVIPAPGAIFLGSIGSGLVMWLRRRRVL